MLSSQHRLLAVSLLTGGHSVIQIIDSLVIPPTSFPDTAERFSTAIEYYGLDSFLGAFYATSNTTLATLLNTTSDLAIFAPNNIGMEGVTPTITSLSNSSLDDLLAYHIVVNPTGPIFTTNFTNGTTLTTLQGSTLTLTFSSNSWFVNSARILTQDLLLANGVMQVIDNVLDPNITYIQPNPTSATQPPVLQTTTASDFNSSAAPFMTVLPNAIVTENPATETAAVYSATATGVGGVPTETATGGGTTEPTSGTTTGAATRANVGWQGVAVFVVSGLGLVAGAFLL